MYISGVKIDFQDIMSSARSSIISEFAAKPWRYESENWTSQLYLALRRLAWHEMTECLKSRGGKKDGSVKAEEAVAEAMRRGLDREDIRFRKKSFIVHLANAHFRVRKRDDGYAAGPETVGGYIEEVMGWCSPSMFADLMFAFDSLVPRIDSEAASVLESVLEAKRSIEREKMAEQIRMTAVRALIDKYLTPLGILCTPSVNGENVILQMELLKRGSIEALMEDLPHLLEDTAAIMEALKPIMERKLRLFR